MAIRFDENAMVTAQVFGVYTHGKLAGKTNPKQFVTMTVYGREVAQCLGKLNTQTGGAFYKITSIDDGKPKEGFVPVAA